MKIGVVIIARNEAKQIDTTLSKVVNQTIKPVQIVCVNDNSTDNTRCIARKYGCDVIDFPCSHPNWVVDKKLANVFNLGLKQLRCDLDYVCILGADHILTNDYLEKVTNRLNEKTIMGSGIIENEEKIINPRGSGRIIDYKWFKNIGFFPVNYGFESYVLFKCRSMGFDFALFHDIKTIVQRKTTTNYSMKKFFLKGKALRALGYYPHMCFIASLRYYYNPLCLIMLLIGYLSPNTKKYEKEVIDSMRKYQVKRIKKSLRMLRLDTQLI